ncbi:MAG: anthranilate phosphoribosyltransferase [Phycisphaeraceae bacterium]|nr:anthranilate phosphoribosyltransferase [Phycisphaeraceae bacterium]
MKQLLSKLAGGESLSVDEAIEAFELVMSGGATSAQIAALLSLIQARGATGEEIVGAARVMRAKVSGVEVPGGLRVIDTCGTGGTHSRTFNVSTAAALVAAAAGRPRGVAVAKHGNRSVTSRSGSSEVLAALGVNIQATGAVLTRCLEEAGICFCFAPLHHPAMKHAAPVRGELGFRTIFNLLGPLTNPAGARRQVMGVYSGQLTGLLAEVLRELGSEEAMVVHGTLADGSGLGEVVSCGRTRIAHLKDGEIVTEELDSSELGLTSATPAALSVESPGQSAGVIRGVLEGKGGPAREMVCLNAAAALRVAGLAEDWAEGLTMAQEAIDSGAGMGTLRRLVEVSGGGRE